MTILWPKGMTWSVPFGKSLERAGTVSVLISALCVTIKVLQVCFKRVCPHVPSLRGQRIPTSQAAARFQRKCRHVTALAQSFTRRHILDEELPEFSPPLLRSCRCGSTLQKSIRAVHEFQEFITTHRAWARPHWTPEQSCKCVCHMSGTDTEGRVLREGCVLVDFYSETFDRINRTLAKKILMGRKGQEEETGGKVRGSGTNTETLSRAGALRVGLVGGVPGRKGQRPLILLWVTVDGKQALCCPAK